MRSNIKIAFSVALIFSLGFLVDCSSTGEPGPDGMNGVNGTDGTTGVNGVGYDEAVKYGKIDVTLTGKRPDGINFTQSISFQIAPADKKYSGWSYPDQCEVIFESQVRRYLTLDNNPDSYASAIIDYYDCEGSGTDFTLHLKTSVSFDTDKVYFNIDQDFYGYVGQSGFTLSPELPEADSDGNLDYTFSMTSSDNPTGHDLIISGTIDAVVFEEIIFEGGRVGGRVMSEHIRNKSRVGH